MYELEKRLEEGGDQAEAPEARSAPAAGARRVAPAQGAAQVGPQQRPQSRGQASRQPLLHQDQAPTRIPIQS